tara:strand:+ start:59 stop:235 length:177 start_codon:yes stop_codon:yes gene_type:complete
MTKEELQKSFCKIIWEAEISNLTIDEYLTENPSIEQTWIALEKECKKQGINVFEVCHK